MTKIEKLLSVKSVISLSPGHTHELKGGRGNGESSSRLNKQGKGNETPPPWIAE